MGFFDRFKRKIEPQGQMETKKQAGKTHVDSSTNVSKDLPNIDMGIQVSHEEKEIVSIISTAIAAGDHPNSVFRVKSITGIDTEKEIVAAIISAIAAGSNPNSRFQLKSITEIK